jgi:transcriptional regulator with XRE-family HTH domain
MECTKIKGDKIRKKRGNRSIRDVVKDANRAFTPASLSNWERGAYQPTFEKLPHLLAALGCSYEDIAEPVPLTRN